MFFFVVPLLGEHAVEKIIIEEGVQIRRGEPSGVDVPVLGLCNGADDILEHVDIVLALHCRVVEQDIDFPLCGFWHVNHVDGELIVLAALERVELFEPLVAADNVPSAAVDNDRIDQPDFWIFERLFEPAFGGWRHGAWVIRSPT